MKHCWKGDFIEPKENSNVSYLSCVLIAMRLVILFLDVKRRITIEVETNKEVKEMRIENITKIKARSLATLLKRKLKIDLMIMMMKWCMLP